MAAGTVPHGVLVTNPPYGAEHKQRRFPPRPATRLVGGGAAAAAAAAAAPRSEGDEESEKGKKRRRRGEEDQGSEQEKKSKEEGKEETEEEVAERENNDGEAAAIRGRGGQPSLDAVVRPKPFLLLMPARVAAGEFALVLRTSLPSESREASGRRTGRGEEEEEKKKEEEGAALEGKQGSSCAHVEGSGRGEACSSTTPRARSAGSAPSSGLVLRRVG